MMVVFHHVHTSVSHGLFIMDHDSPLCCLFRLLPLWEGEPDESVSDVALTFLTVTVLCPAYL